MPTALPRTPEAIRHALDDAYWRGRADEARERGISAGLAVAARPSPAAVFAAVGAATGTATFCKRTRSRAGHRERLVAALLLREECHLSYPAIADLLGYKHHSGVMVRMRGARLNADILALVECARQHLRAQSSRDRKNVVHLLSGAA